MKLLYAVMQMHDDETIADILHYTYSYDEAYDIAKQGEKIFKVLVTDDQKYTIWREDDYIGLIDNYGNGTYFESVFELEDFLGYELEEDDLEEIC